MNGFFSDIRKATYNDLDKIEMLYNDINDYFSSKMNYPGWIKGIYPIRETAYDGIKENNLFILVINNEIAGSVILNHKPESAYKKGQWKSESDYKDIVVIHTLVISPYFLRKGYGLKLMKFAEKYSRENKMKAIRLDTSENNLPAIALYEKLGYKYAGKVDLGLGYPHLKWFILYELIL